MNNKKKFKEKIANNEIKILIGVVAFIIIGTLFATSYAFFNYTVTSDSIVSGGYIKFDFQEGNNAVALGNSFPITEADIDNTVTRIFTLSGHTTYEEGIRYNVYVVYGDNVVGKTRLRDDVISFQFIPPTDADGFTNEVNNCSTPTNLTFTNGKALVASGLIKDTESLTIMEGYTIKMFIDGSKINISSTTKRATNAEGNPSLADATSGTTTATRYMRNDTTEPTTITLYPAITSQQGKIIYTTNEFSNSYYSFKIMIEAEEEKPPICKRVTDATKLHTETCSQTSDYCAGDGYTGDNTLITYGNAKTLGSALIAGDAFDCDVNGNGIIDEDGNGNSIERFYYVSEYYNTDTKVFDNTTGYATLIYYSNTLNGLPSDGKEKYNSVNGDNWHGPVTASPQLPTTSTWSNTTLKTVSRTILACSNADCNDSEDPKLTTKNGTYEIVNPYSYDGKAARLLTVQEIKRAGCDTASGQISLGNLGSLKMCNFLFERTAYNSSAINGNARGILLENPNSNTNYNVWQMYAESRKIDLAGIAANTMGIRPVIDVPYSRMKY